MVDHGNPVVNGMNPHDAMQWLDDRGGGWCVRAHSGGCVVVANLGPKRVEVPARRLDRDDVDGALVRAVLELRGLGR